MRATMSTEPPGASGTMSVIGRAGNSCAWQACTEMRRLRTMERRCPGFKAALHTTRGRDYLKLVVMKIQPNATHRRKGNQGIDRSATRHLVPPGMWSEFA